MNLLLLWPKIFDLMLIVSGLVLSCFFGLWHERGEGRGEFWLLSEILEKSLGFIVEGKVLYLNLRQSR